MTLYYSAKDKGFLDGSKKEIYVNAGTWPDDAISVSVEVFIEFTNEPPAGHLLGANVDGSPVWVIAPKKSQAELIFVAEQEREILIENARSTIDIWQIELQLGIISDENKDKLVKSINYIKKLQLLDLSLSPVIEWPELEI